VKIKRAYRQGVVTTTTHSTLKEGQVVDIIFEGHDFYTVQCFVTGSQEKIDKKFVITH
jgi:ribosomal protein L31